MRTISHLLTLAFVSWWVCGNHEAAAFGTIDIYRSSRHHISGSASDAGGNLYICGSLLPGPVGLTNSAVFGRRARNVSSAFLVKLDPAGRVLASVVIGGSGRDEATRVAVDAEGRPVIVGVTHSPDFPGEMFSQINTPAAVHAFVCRFDESGTNLLFAAQFPIADGESALAMVNGVAIDPAGDIYLTGTESAAGFPATAVIGNPVGFGSRAFVVKIRRDGAELLYSTVIGHAGPDVANAIAVDASGHAYIAGLTQSQDFPTTGGSIQPYPGFEWSGVDAFVAKLAEDGNSLLFSTYLGGECEDSASSIALDRDGFIYVGGQTCSAEFPGEISQTGFATRGFIAKLDADATGIIYTRSFSYSARDNVTAIMPRPDGTVFVAGTIGANIVGSGLPFLAVGDSSGAFTLEPVANCRQSGSIDAISAGRSGNVYVHGRRENMATGFSSFAAKVSGTPATANPRIVLVEPQVEALRGSPATVQIRAALLGTSEEPVTVKFYDGRRLLGVTTNAPHQITVSNLTRGVHRISASATIDGTTYSSCRLAVRVRPPQNDHFANSSAKSGERFSARGTTRGATAESLGVWASGDKDVWWSWTAPRDGVFEVRVSSRVFAPLLAVFTGSAVTDLVEVGQAVQSPPFLNRVFTWKATAGVPYHFRAATYGYPADFRIEVRPATPPANDNFADRLVIESGIDTIAGKLRHATREPDEAVCNGWVCWQDNRVSVWYAWTAPSAGTFVASVDEPNRTASPTVYSGDALTSITNRGTAVIGLVQATEFSAQAGESFPIAVLGYTGTSNFVLRIQPHSAPANDHFADRIQVSGENVAVTGSSIGATREPEEPQSMFQNHGSVWWSWTAPSSGSYRVNVRVESTPGRAGVPGAPNSAPLVVYTGETLPGLEYVTSGAIQGGVLVNAEAGKTYAIALSHTPIAEFRFSIEPVTPPGNDNFADAMPLLGAAVVVRGDLRNATIEANEPSPIHQASVWYRWIAPGNGTYAISVSPFTAVVAVYSGATIESLVQAAAVSSRVGLQITAGTEYSIAVLGTSPSSDYGNPFLLRIRPIQPPANDDFANREILSGFVVDFTAFPFNATAEPDEPWNLFSSPRSSVWFSWTSPTNGLFSVESLGSFGANIHIFTGGELAALQAVEASTFAGVPFQAAAGETYQIAVDGAYLWRDEGIPLRLRYMAPPPNDMFADRPLLTGANFTVVATNFGALSRPSVTFRAPSEVGRTNIIETSTDLRQWFPDETNVSAGGSDILRVPNSGEPQRFLRLR